MPASTSSSLFSTIACLTLLFGLPALAFAGLIIVGNSSKPKEIPVSIKDQYPDEHFFV